MLHLQAVKEEKASPTVKDLYAQIKAALHTTTVPLVFQYIANFENYFLYLWQQLYENLTHPSFEMFINETKEFSYQAIMQLYVQDSKFVNFISLMHSSERQNISQTVEELITINASLLILLISIRESLKGIMIGTPQLHAQAYIYKNTPEIFQNTQEIFIKNIPTSSQELTEATKMLAPLFGQNTIIISQYPDFFTLIAEYIVKLIQKEEYLRERVDLERIILRIVERLPSPIENSYQKLVELAGNQPYFTELLYLLSETFPSQFPRLMMTSSLMKRVISYDNSNHLQIK